MKSLLYIIVGLFLIGIVSGFGWNGDIKIESNKGVSCINNYYNASWNQSFANIYYVPYTGANSNIQTGIFNITSNGSISSEISGSKISFLAKVLTANRPRARFEIGNSSTDVNLGLVITPSTTSAGAGVRRETFIQVSTNSLTTDSTARQVLLYVTGYKSIIASQASDSGGATNPANPLYFVVGHYDGTSRNGIIVNNDSNNTVTIGSNTIRKDAQLNVIARSTENASAYFSSKIGIGTIAPKNLVTINGTGMLQLLGNTTTQTCNLANEGGIYYDNSTKKHWGCNSTDWNALY
jgi:hypothetical protein